MRGRGDQTGGTQRSSEQGAGHLITERVLLHACHRLAGSLPSPVGLRMHPSGASRHVGPADRPAGHPSCGLLRCNLEVVWRAAVSRHMLHDLKFHKKSPTTTLCPAQNIALNIAQYFLFNAHQYQCIDTVYNSVIDAIVTVVGSHCSAIWNLSNTFGVTDQISVQFFFSCLIHLKNRNILLSFFFKCIQWNKSEILLICMCDWTLPGKKNTSAYNNCMCTTSPKSVRHKSACRKFLIALYLLKATFLPCEVSCHANYNKKWTNYFTSCGCSRTCHFNRSFCLLLYKTQSFYKTS